MIEAIWYVGEVHNAGLLDAVLYVTTVSALTLHGILLWIRQTR